MRFEISERLTTSRSDQELLATLQEQFRKTARRVDIEGQRFKATALEASFGSINRKDETIVYVKSIEGGHLLVADVLYRPSLAFWIILLFTFFTWIGWVIPIFFYMTQKKTVAAAVRNCFERVKNEHAQPSAGISQSIVSVENGLEQLVRLKDRGLLTEEEFAAQKQSLLGATSRVATQASLAQPNNAGSFTLDTGTSTLQHDLPPGVKGWSWGGFLLNFIWAIPNKTWIGMLALVPIIGLPIPFLLGWRGREWAWRNRRWESVEHFVKVQRQWAIWGIAFYVIALTLIAIGKFYPFIEAKLKPSNPVLITAEQFGHADSTATIDQTQPSESNTPSSQITASAAPSAQPASGNGIFDKGVDSNFMAVTVAGTVSMVEDSEQNHFIALNGTPLFKGDDAKYQYPIKLFTLSNDEQALLIESSGGRGTSCESLFFFVLINRSGALKWTPEFGTCVRDGTYAQSQAQIDLSIPKIGGFAHYVLANGQVTEENGNHITYDQEHSNDPAQ